jgi:hypothetical protein
MHSELDRFKEGGFELDEDATRLVMAEYEHLGASFLASEAALLSRGRGGPHQQLNW